MFGQLIEKEFFVYFDRTNSADNIYLCKIKIRIN